MTCDELYTLLQQEFPTDEAMPGDRLGIQIEPPGHRVEQIMTCLEVTDKVLDEALANSCNTIITFHPLIYTPLESLRPNDRVARCIQRAVRSSIAIISVHTTLDAHPNGTNAHLARLLSVQVEQPLLPSKKRPSYGMGVVGYIDPPRSVHQYAQFIAERLSTTVRYCVGAREQIRHIAIVAGSGTSFLDAAIAAGADAFITADVKYHTFHRASGTIAIIDPGHYEMEQHVPLLLAERIAQILQGNNIQIPVYACTVRTSPVHTEKIPSTIEIESSTTVSE